MADGLEKHRLPGRILVARTRIPARKTHPKSSHDVRDTNTETRWTSTALHVLQLRPEASDAQDVPGRGRWRRGSRVVDRGNRRAARPVIA